jgi:hypothetical protein
VVLLLNPCLSAVRRGLRRVADQIAHHGTHGDFSRWVQDVYGPDEDEA